MCFKKHFHRVPGLFIVTALILMGCDDESNTLVPYSGSPPLSGIAVEAESFKPSVTWLGGYVSVIGVNVGHQAALDTSLIWLTYVPDNDLRYPIRFGEVPGNGEDLTAQYGGVPADSLLEDNDYTFWVMKASAWRQIEGESGKIIRLDSLLDAETVNIQSDTVFVGPMQFSDQPKVLDVYVNLENVRAVGRLGVIDVEQPTTSNNPRISWEILQDEVTDTLIAAMGITEGQQYDGTRIVWEVYSVDSSGGTAVYGKNNVIEKPLTAGQSFDSTFVFTAYPEGGLERDNEYYIWIANEKWDGVGRLRVTPYYAYVTFRTW